MKKEFAFSKNDTVFPNSGHIIEGHDGLTKLEWFAGNIISTNRFPSVIKDGSLTTYKGSEVVAKEVYDLAEAMLKESEKRSK